MARLQAAIGQVRICQAHLLLSRVLHRQQDNGIRSSPHLEALEMTMRCFVLHLPASAQVFEWTQQTLALLQSDGGEIVEALMEAHGVS